MNGKVADVKEVIVMKFMRAINEVCSKKIVWLMNDWLLFGGPGKIVEIDEVHLAEGKYMRGSELLSEHFLVFGIIRVE